ncbi:hydrolase of the alpha/beta superfamily protein [Mycobacteroides abscessus subsp. massiliense]|uniref:alpha/beta hydrolase family protein n=1 Tax=Mycobacteroides abscessus TaxID=36809 RepID=UPI0009A5EC7C|nr:alpha/beta hydrolase [Mycobacteroides abscessus]SKF98284.1 hydrolase of the alpha/beta superfamily protein [Mycobacteroides abscessus subsp. massiliense]SKG27638.1 hydrolase of the alpha/beta superfamily protein [Mycobacteroides abscessus subsp. massiliense]SKH46964.1 hydrolase of the alpha/beta superfamily protein [Mycobacteroides abscessus subsp. massiliense]SKI72045.1 hydrolase of the alpha/beta superfamily protein [Mycobacteroides abscessus subsp. massiliense]SKP51988.1 Esterase/lipase 
MAERVTFPSCTGPTLTGVIDRPDGAIRGWGVFSHGFTLGKDCPAAARICKQLARDGIAMMRFDALGLGDSDGDWGDGSFTVKANDVIAASTFMAERGTPADILIGHSFGGAAVLAAARDSPGVRAVVTVGAPMDPVHAEIQYDAVVETVLAEGSATWMVGGKALTLKRAFVEDVRAADLQEKIRSLRLPLLILHSPTDNTVGIENASRIFQTARHPRSFVSLEGSNHFLFGPGEARRAGRIIGAWADAYLGD